MQNVDVRKQHSQSDLRFALGTHTVFYSGRREDDYHVSLGSDWYVDSLIAGNKFHFLNLFFFPRNFFSKSIL